MFFAVIGHSEDIDADGALEDLIEQCKAELGDRPPQAGMMFAGHEMDRGFLLEGVCDTWPDLALIGCTTDGELSSRLGFRQDSVVLVLFGSDRVEFTVGIGQNLSEDVAGACSRAVDAALADATQAPAICLTLPESLTCSGQAVVEALSDKLGGDVPVFGATSGDGYELLNTYQFCGREIFQDSIPVLVLSGPLVYSAAVASGWEPLGEPGVVTRSDSTLLIEIDGRPAMEFYRRFLGPDGAATSEFPLAILNEHGAVEALRTPRWEETDVAGAINFMSEISEGASVQITTADRGAILHGCSTSVEKAFADYPHGKSPEAALIFSCCCRRLLLGTRTKEEFDIVATVLGSDLPVAGFYGYGEIGPPDSSEGLPVYHNEVFVSLILGT
ncbi:FIST C-terminal domain-containing protein [Acidimicrobiaceae bacterium]|nr:FIST C-terminal domain-containing protein [Acidimicrobiaceae bacterium]